ncbi:NEDD4-binding protein 2-like [Haliotis asinina]|uniref:NEDD4-binding protein 2-like n=1 Tax=Haliotis asinina TaxID=109174 RepID=UPI003531D334
MPRSTRNRSSSPQKISTKAGTDNLSETKRMERDRLYQEIQEMFQDTIDPEVVHLVLTECNWGVDEAIETLFAMSQNEQLEKKDVSKDTDLDVIACSLIGEVESKRQPHSTTSMGEKQVTKNIKPVLQPMENIDPAEIVLSGSHPRTPGKGEEKSELDLFTLKSPSFPMDVSDVEYQTYMDMYNVYGTYVPEIMDSIQLKEELLKNSPTKSSSLSQSVEGDTVILSPTSGISNIGLLDPVCLKSSNKRGGNGDSCPSDKQCVDTAPHTFRMHDSDAASLQLKGVHTSMIEDTRISEMDTFSPLKGEFILVQDSGRVSSKGGNSNTHGHSLKLLSDSYQRTGSHTDEDGSSRDTCETGVSESHESMLSASHKRPGSQDKGASDLISMPPLSAEAPVFVPRFTSVPPPPGINRNPQKTWCLPGELEGNPIFMTPKGPHPQSRLPLKHNPQSFLHSRWQRPSIQATQPKPLKPLPSMAARNPYKFSGSALQTIPPPPSSDHFPTMSGRRPVSQTQSSTNDQMIYSKAAAKPALTPAHVTLSTSRSIPTTNNQVISCAQQIELVKTYVAKGRQLLVLLRGLPGSGKSYLAREIVFHGVILSTDDYFLRCGDYRYNQDQLTEAHTWNKQRACDAMDRRVSPVIIDNTNTMEWEMLPYVKMAVARGYDVEVLEPSTPWKFHPKVLAKRNSHGVGRDAIRKMNQRYQQNVTAAGLLARASQHSSIKEPSDARDVSPTKSQKEDVKTSVRLVQYDLSSEEEQDDAGKVLVKPPAGQTPTVKQGPVLGTPSVLKLNLNIKTPLTNKQVSESGSAPTSPKKRKRKKRKASSSKSEVMQTIEEILQSCGEGEIEDSEWRVREEEIQALLFMSPLSESEKQDIQVWLNEKMDNRKTKSSVPPERENAIAMVVEDIQNERCKISSLKKQLIDMPKSVVPEHRESVGGEGVTEAKMTPQDVDENESCDITSWSQLDTGPKPRRCHLRRTRPNHKENDDQSDSTLEKEKDNMPKTDLSEQQTQFISMEAFQADEKQIDENEEVDTQAACEVSDPQGEQNKSGNIVVRSKAEATADAFQAETAEGLRAVSQEAITEAVEITSRGTVRGAEALVEIKEKESTSGCLEQNIGDVPASVTDTPVPWFDPSEDAGDASEDSEEAFESFDSDKPDICSETASENMSACDQQEEDNISKEEKQDDSFMSLSASSREGGDRELDASVATEREVGQEEEDDNKEEKHDSFLSLSASSREGDDRELDTSVTTEREVRQDDLQPPLSDKCSHDVQKDSQCAGQQTQDNNDVSGETGGFFSCEPSEECLIVKPEETSTDNVNITRSEVSTSFESNNSNGNGEFGKKNYETIEGDIMSPNLDISKTLEGSNVVTIDDPDLRKTQEDAVIQKTLKKKSKTHRKKQGNVLPFLDNDAKQKFQTENWSSFGLPTMAQSSDSKVSEMRSVVPKGRRIACRSFYSFTSSRDFAFLKDINCNKPLHQIKDSEQYTVLLGKSRDINFEKTQRMKTKTQSPEEQRIHYSVSLDKGCMTDELDLQVPADVEFLVKAFPGAEENHLRDALDICQGNVEWTVNLLLDWGETVPFSSVDKEEISSQMKQKTPDKTVKLAKQSPPTKCPLSLFDLCQKAIDANSLASNDEVQDKVIKTGYQRLQRMESHSMMRVRSISQSESSLTNDSVLTDIIQASSPVLSDAYGRSRKHGSLINDTDVSTKGDWGVVDDWSEEDGCMLEDDAHVTLPVPEELVRDLEELFGPVQSSLTGCELFEVTLDMRTAKRLFENLHRRPASREAHIRQQTEEFRKQELRRQSEERAREKQLRQDEALARKLQYEENQGPQQGKETSSCTLRNSKSAVASESQGLWQHGGSTHMFSKKQTKPTYNLLDIMKEEQANQQRREEQMRLLDARGDRIAIATKLKRQKLYNHFPGVDENFLEEIFEANGFSLEETVDILRGAVGKTRSPQRASPQHNSGQDDNSESSKMKSLQDLVDQSWLHQETGAVEYQDAAGSMDYDNIRGEANIHHNMRNECFQKAQEAFRRGMKDVASFYSQQGHLHTRKLKEANMRASQKIMEHRSSFLMQHGTLDLHGFHVDEAISILKSVIEDRETDLQARPDRRKQSLFVITGKGRHSRGGVAKLRPAIINHLNNMNYRYTEQQPGLFKIYLQYRA